MAAETELLTVNEAAIVSRCSPVEVNRAIDNQILPVEFYTLEEGRRLRPEACMLLTIYFGILELTSDARLRLLEAVAGDLHRARKLRNYIVHVGHVDVNLKDLARETDERRADLEAARASVITDPEILGGEPVIAGTRVPVYDVAAFVETGASPDEIRRSYPRLTDRLIELASIYAKANPVRGRPRRSRLLEGAELVSRRKVPRRPH